MVSVDKAGRAPDLSENTGKDPLELASRELKRLYLAAPHDYQSGKRKFQFQNKLYGHPLIKQALIEAQHGKCCFCEAKVKHVAHGDIEHFRPKGAVRQSPDGHTIRPGYYWLAYRWENLFFSCQICNQHFKKDLFPLEDPARRALDHRQSIDPERPLLLRPDEPCIEDHIRFQAATATPARRSPRGTASIQLYGLNRPDLLDSRLNKLQLVRNLISLWNSDLPDTLRQPIGDNLRLHFAPGAEYLAMLRDNFPDFNP